MVLKAKDDEVIVSDHAILRYLERYFGVDIERVRQSILADGRGELVRKLRSGRFPIDTSGTKIVAKDGVIITVVTRSR